MVNARSIGPALVALLLTIFALAPADAAADAVKVLHPPSDPEFTATVTMHVAGSSFALTMEISTVAAATDGDHCGMLEVRWVSGLDQPFPLGACGSLRSEFSTTNSGSPVPSDVEVRICDAQVVNGATVATSTCTGWELLYAGNPDGGKAGQSATGKRQAWGPVRARGGMADGRGLVTKSHGRTLVRVTLADRTRGAACGWAVVTGGGHHGHSVACNRTRHSTVRLGHAKRLTIMICAGTRQRLDPGTCRGVRLG